MLRPRWRSVFFFFFFFPSFFFSPQHYAVIGPYDHFGTHSAAKSPVLRGYALDPVAQFSTPDLVLDWMDFIFHGKPKPELLKDKINFEVMGANTWRHAPSLDAMSASHQRLYFSGCCDAPATQRLADLHLPVPAVCDGTALHQRPVHRAHRNQRCFRGHATRCDQQERLRLRHHGVRDDSGRYAVQSRLVAATCKLRPVTPLADTC